MTALERRSRRLLRAYPARYRRERGEEILGTLLDDSPPGRRWPSPRDARALIMGGLRVRAGLNQPQATAAGIRLGMMLGAALTLIQINAGVLTGLVNFWTHAYPEPAPPRAGYQAAYAILALAAVATAWFAPRIISAGMAVAAAALWAWWGGNGNGWVIPAVIMLIMLAILARGSQRPPRSWLWLAGLWLAISALQGLSNAGRQQPLFALYTPLHYISWIILGAVVLWIVVDARPGIALATYAASFYALPQILGYAGYQAPPLAASWLYFSAASTLILAATAAWRLRQSCNDTP